MFRSTYGAPGGFTDALSKQMESVGAEGKGPGDVRLSAVACKVPSGPGVALTMGLTALMKCFLKEMPWGRPKSRLLEKPGTRDRCMFSVGNYRDVKQVPLSGLMALHH